MGEEILRWEADLGTLFISPDTFCLCLAGKQLELVEIEAGHESWRSGFVAHAATVKATQRELNEARELLDALSADSPERPTMLRRLFNQHYWLARSVQAADKDSPFRSRGLFRFDADNT